MKINKDAYVPEEGDDSIVFAMALGKMEAHFEGLIEEVEMGDNPLAKEYLEELREDGFLED